MTILKSILLLGYREPKTTKEKMTRLVIQVVGEIDKTKKLLFTYFPTVLRPSMRIILPIPI